MDKPLMLKLETPERSRTYYYADGHKRTFTNVVAICVRPSGTHRLETEDGKKWIVVPGWEASNWTWMRGRSETKETP